MFNYKGLAKDHMGRFQPALLLAQTRF